MISDIQIYSLGEKALTIELGKTIDAIQYQRVVSLQKLIESMAIEGIIEMVPSYCSLTIYYEPFVLKNRLLKTPESISQRFKKFLFEIIKNWKPEIEAVSTSEIIEIPVCYEPQYGLDLEEIAAFHQCSIDDIIKKHSSAIYTVFIVGFLPGFPYLGILPDELATPRKKQPRLKVPSGSVAIGGNQTGIYPIESPGGWNIVGQTPMKIFDKERANPFLLKPGNQVKFTPITEAEFENYKL